tara:strand:- start:2137 stop:2565 length:429 start_codon:yes stop_codon:yes gene_type:complete
MKSFKEYILNKKVKKRSPDPAEARSLILQATERMKDLINLPLNEGNASFRFEDAYEALREALQSFISLAGYKSYSHEAIVSFAFENKLLSEAQTNRADRYREIRNDINYRGKRIIIEEANEIIKFVEDLLPVLKSKLDETLK